MSIYFVVGLLSVLVLRGGWSKADILTFIPATLMAVVIDYVWSKR